MKIKNNIWFIADSNNKWKFKIIFDLLDIVIKNEKLKIIIWFISYNNNKWKF